MRFSTSGVADDAAVVLFVDGSLPAGAGQDPGRDLADANYPPYSWREGGGGEGIYADIVRSVTASMDEYEVVLKAMPWRRGLSMVEQGSAFAIFPPYYQPDSRPGCGPTPSPCSTRLVVMCGAGVAVNTPQAQFPADYYGLRFGMNAGFTIGGAPSGRRSSSRRSGWR